MRSLYYIMHYEVSYSLNVGYYYSYKHFQSVPQQNRSQKIPITMSARSMKQIHGQIYSRLGLLEGALDIGDVLKYFDLRAQSAAVTEDKDLAGRSAFRDFDFSTAVA